MPEEKVSESPPCRHEDTVPAERERWRICKDCLALVHRSDTAHFERVSKQVM